MGSGKACTCGRALVRAHFHEHSDYQPYVLLKGPGHPDCCRSYIQTQILMKGNSVTEGPPWPDSESHLILRDRDYWSHFVARENRDSETVGSWDSDPTQLDPKFHVFSCCLLYTIENTWPSHGSLDKRGGNKRMSVPGGAERCRRWRKVEKGVGGK